MAKRSTSTSTFGVSKRESHNASDFYRRFTPPVVSWDSDVAPHRDLDKLIVGDARQMDEVPDASAALVVTSPPYFAGKEYEEALGEGGVPANYLEYLALLREVFAQCVRKLEPGGRIAVNVANLGRRPYRSLSADVIGILQDDLRLLLRGEIVWLKQRGSSGSCAWGSFQRPGNPVLRDLTERVVVASKGRFDRAIAAKDRARSMLPSESSITRDDFMENTLDVWEIPAESATRVGHPAPFPIELPARLIDLYTSRGDLVLDPFAGSGTTAVAALRAGRHFAGYDLDEAYIRLAERRVEEERRRLERERPDARPWISVPASPVAQGGDEDLLSLAVRRGRGAKHIAGLAVELAGFTDIRTDQRQPGGVEVSFTARDSGRQLWFFDVMGTLTGHPGSAKRTGALWKALGKAAVLREVGSTPLVLLTTWASSRAAAEEPLRRMVGPGKPLHAVVDVLTPAGVDALKRLCEAGPL
jgi:DNA modification methylase